MRGIGAGAGTGRRKTAAASARHALPREAAGGGEGGAAERLVGGIQIPISDNLPVHQLEKRKVTLYT